VRVGILILNYHHAHETLDCVRNLMAREPETTRLFWIENDATETWEETRGVLDGAGVPWTQLDPSAPAVPPAGTVGVIRNADNLGFAGGNNAGLRLLHALDVPYAWVLNNDTLVLRGTSSDLVRAAETRTEVGAWGTPLITRHNPCYFGGIVSLKDFSIKLAQSPDCLEREPLSYVSGCSLFIRTEVAAKLGYLPERYFLYYEDPAFGLELRRAGFTLSGVWDVLVFHIESLSTGRRSRLMEFYNRRNRWHFIQAYFPDHLPRQKRRLWYHLQKYFFRLEFRRMYLELIAYLDFKAGLLGRTHRDYSRLRRK
jgi:hypothetical protein